MDWEIGADCTPPTGVLWIRGPQCPIGFVHIFDLTYPIVYSRYIYHNLLNTTKNGSHNKTLDAVEVVVAGQLLKNVARNTGVPHTSMRRYAIQVEDNGAGDSASSKSTTI